MNKSLVILLVIVAAVIIGLPLAGKLMQSSETAGTEDGSAPAASPESVETAAPFSPAAPAPAPAGAPGLDYNSLVNTVWSIKFDKISLTVTFLPGGALQAQSPMLKALVGTDTVGGAWSISGSNVNVSASAGGRTVSETAVISGNQLLVNGQPARRMR